MFEQPRLFAESAVPPPDRMRLALTKWANAQTDMGPVARLLVGNGLTPVFQPIASLHDCSVNAFEALIRGPQGTSLHGPDALFASAAAEGLRYQLEVEALLVAVAHWADAAHPGRLFLNISADLLVRLWQEIGLVQLVSALGETPVKRRRLVFELTEHERVSDIDALARAVADLRTAGLHFALDDFGDGHSSLRLWAQIKPDLVKIDKYFIRNLAGSPDRLQTIRALLQIAEVFGTQLVAEGIETVDDLRIVRDLGISFGQGYLLGRPSPAMNTINEAAAQALQDRRVTVFPEMKRVSMAGRARPLQVITAPTLRATNSNADLLATFLAHPELHAVALVTADEQPVALVNRHQFMTAVARPFFREIFGRDSCLKMANSSPRILEFDAELDDLLEILTSADQRYLTEGLILTREGRYLGLGTGEQLVRSVTEMRIEAARHANPLTFLPGNIPISQHIERLLAAKGEFVACYADLNHFKPFNDQYGYWRGDEMIRLLARTCIEMCDPRNDFVGHVGGDDFVLLMQSHDWEARCQRIVGQFNAQAVTLFDAEARANGGIHCEDRQGVIRFFTFTTLAIGAVCVKPGLFRDADEVANQAAHAKHTAKVSGLGLAIERP